MISFKPLRNALLMGVASFSGVAAASAIVQPAYAQEATRAYNIDAQDLNGALRQFAMVTGRDVLYPPEIVANKRSPGVHGQMTQQQALQALLAGSGLQFTQTASNGFAVRDPNSPTRLGDAQGAASSSDSDEEIVVTGTRIRGRDPVGSAVTVVDRRDIDNSGYASLSEVLNTVSQTGPSVRSDAPDYGGTSSRPNGNVGYLSGINLRGLGLGTTLVLVNGQRQPAAGNYGQFFDIANIPLSAIERVEVLPDGASAIYGADAIGGVVNVILRRNYEGFETRVRFGTLDGDGNEYNFSQIFGSTWGSGNLIAGYEYHRREPLPASARRYSANSDQTANGGDNFSDISANPGNIFDPNTFDIYAIPAGQDGRSLTPGDLLPGVTNYRNTNVSYDLLPADELHSIFLHASQRIGQRIELQGDVRYSYRPVHSNTTATGFFEVPDTNPFFVDPVGGNSSVFVAYDLTPDLHPRYEAVTNTYQADLNAQIELNGDWRMSAGLSFARQDGSYRSDTYDFDALTTALADSNPATAFNPFGDGSNTPTSTIERIRAVSRGDSSSSTYGATLSVDGTAIRLPAGDLRLAGGLEYRQEDMDTSLGGIPPAPVNGLSRSDQAAFLEARIPIVGENNALPFVRSANLSLAGRYENYSDWGSTVVPKVGFDLSPTEGLVFRGTWGRSFKPPLLVDRDTTVFNPVVGSLLNLPDPASSTGFTRVLARFGGNPDLNPERGVEWTFGVDWRPPLVSGLNIRLTYFDTTYQDRIAPPGTPGREFLILEESNIWGNFIVRNPTDSQLAEFCTGIGTAAPLSACLSPRVEAIVDERLQNIAYTRANGVDLQITESIATGHGPLDLGLSATYNISNEFAVTRGATSVGTLDQVGNPLSLKLRATADWTLDAWNIHAALNYSPAYTDPLSGLSGTRRRVDSWTTFDAGVRLDLGTSRGLFHGVSINANVVNLFDSDPPYVNARLGYDPVNADPFGRMISIELVKSW